MRKQKLMRYGLLAALALAFIFMGCDTTTGPDKQEYTITFNTTGGSAVAPVEVEEGTTVQLASYITEKSSATFEGWYLSTDATQAIIPSVTVNSDITLVAKWEGEFTVTFDTDGGSTIASQSVDSGTTIILGYDLLGAITWNEEYVPEKSGFVFGGWYVSGDTTKELILDIEVTENITLVAIWATGVTVTFDTDGGSAIAPVTVAPGSTLILGYNLLGSISWVWEYTPQKIGNVFAGWYKSGDVNETVILSIEVNEDTTLVATWVAGFTVTLDLDGGEFEYGESLEYTYISGDYISRYDFPTPVKSEVAFYGWYLSTDVNEDLIDSLEITEDITLVAKWGQAITVTFHLNGGTLTLGGATTVQAAPGDLIFLPSVYRTGYTLAGWYDNADFIGLEVGLWVSVETDNIDLYAKWVEGSSGGSDVTITITGVTVSDIAYVTAELFGDYNADIYWFDPIYSTYTFTQDGTTIVFSDFWEWDGTGSLRISLQFEDNSWGGSLYVYTAGDELSDYDISDYDDLGNAPLYNFDGSPVTIDFDQFRLISEW